MNGAFCCACFCACVEPPTAYLYPTRANDTKKNPWHDETTGKVLHHIFVSHAFLDDHAEAEIVPALENLALLECLEMADGRRVFVRSQMIEIEAGA